MRHDHSDFDLGPNEKLIGDKQARRQMTTPCLIVDAAILESNLELAQSIADKAGLKLWPHAKTHKCSRLAKLQLKSGAQRICVANLHEAEVLGAAGVGPLLITSPFVGAGKIERLVTLSEDCPDLMITVDNPETVGQIAQALSAKGMEIDVLLDVDIGMGRTGVSGPDEVASLAKFILEEGSMRLAGVQGYSGRIQHIPLYRDRSDVYLAQLERLAQARDILVELGVGDPVVTGGGTGSLLIDSAAGIVRQQQSGSYAFMDVQYGGVDLTDTGSALFSCALTLRTSVINAGVPGQATLDAGIKAVASDGPKPAFASGAVDGATYEFFGDEHGRLVLPSDAARMEVGAAVELITPHCDPNVNLHDFLHVFRDNELIDIWPIDARGSL